MATLLSDDFNRANAATIGAPAVGPSPTVVNGMGGTSGGDWGITSNTCNPKSVVTENLALWDIGATTYDLQATLATLATGGTKVQSLVFRRSTTSAVIAQAVGIAGNVWEMYKWTPGTGFVLLSSSSVGVAAGQVVKVSVTPTSLGLYVNGSLACSSSDTTGASNTQVGFRAYETGVQWDDLSVVTGAAGSSRRFNSFAAQRRQAVIRSAHL